MLEQEMRKRIYKKLEAMEESLPYEIASLCEYLALIREVLMLYYLDNREDLKES